MSENCFTISERKRACAQSTTLQRVNYMSIEAIPEKSGLIVTVGMQKGGVAKTTNATHLAAALGRRGKRVLIWDIDENHGATKLFGIPPEGFLTSWSVLVGDSPVNEAILEFDDIELDVELPDNVDFIPSSRQLEALDATLAQRDKLYNPNDVLKPHIDDLRAMKKYDYIILDTGPTASPTIRGALMTSNYYVLSCVPEKLCVESLPEALADIANARRSDRNPDLVLLGLILSCMDRRKSLAKAYEQAIAEQFLSREEKPVKFSSTISSAAAIEKAFHSNQTLFQFDPNHKVSMQYLELAEEFEERIGALFSTEKLAKSEEAAA